MDLIIGAGITGLSFANFTSNKDFLIIDKDSEIGGYCKTIKQDGFTWDYSGHFFHFRNKAVENYILSQMNDKEVITVQKNTQIYYKGKYIDFPFQKNIHQLEKDEFIDCLYDLFFNEYKSLKTFKQMLYTKFGKSIAEKFLIPYNEKLYACDLDLLDVDAMGRFFPFADKIEIIKNIKDTDNKSYNSTFTYPRGGAIEYVNSLAKRVDNSKISLNESLLEINVKEHIAKTTKRVISYDKLISTIPLPILLDKCSLSYDENIYSWNKVLVFNLGFDKKGDDKINNWVYFPEDHYIFYRIGYYDNIFDDERLSLYVELGFDNNTTINPLDFLEKVLSDLKKAKIITDHKLISFHHVVMDPAYVHINKQSEQNKEVMHKYLSENDIYSIGRYGDWKYCSIEDNIIEAKKLSELLNK